MAINGDIEKKLEPAGVGLATSHKTHDLTALLRGPAVTLHTYNVSDLRFTDTLIGPQV
jgi:hypothetical protein